MKTSSTTSAISLSCNRFLLPTSRPSTTNTSQPSSCLFTLLFKQPTQPSVSSRLYAIASHLHIWQSFLLTETTRQTFTIKFTLSCNHVAPAHGIFFSYVHMYSYQFKKVIVSNLISALHIIIRLTF